MMDLSMDFKQISLITLNDEHPQKQYVEFI